MADVHQVEEFIEAVVRELETHGRKPRRRTIRMQENGRIQGYVVFHPPFGLRSYDSRNWIGGADVKKAIDKIRDWARRSQ